jgi:beta-N-acetylhexosaminidase
VDAVLAKLTPRQKVAQLVVPWLGGNYMALDDSAYQIAVRWVDSLEVGGIIISVGSPYDIAAKLNALQRRSKLPLLVSADLEWGAGMRVVGATAFPMIMAAGATGNERDAYTIGRSAALEGRAVGIHVNFAPDADVNNNPLNPIINLRSYGEDPEQVGDMVAAYIRGARTAGMMTTAKHFPGHGDTATDSHLSVAQVTGDRARLNSVELAPFRKAIAAGVDSIMVAHVTVPALEPDPNRVATTSTLVVTGLLKNQMKFNGIVTTDALDMAGLTRLYAQDVGRAAVEAFKAGNDMLLIPADLDASYQAMLKAVASGEIPQARLDASVLKLLKAKASLGLNKAKLVDVANVGKEVGKPQNMLAGQQVADDAVTLVRENGKVLPLKAVGTIQGGLPYMTKEETHNRLVVIVFSEDVRMSAGRVFDRQVRARVPDANVIYVDPRIAEGMTQEILKVADEAQTVVAAVYATPTPGSRKNSVAVADATGALLNQLLEHAAGKTVVFAMGNPYVVADFPKIDNYLCTFSNETVSEISAVKALFGEIPVHGHLPVSIPNVAQRGAGIERQARLAQGDPQHEHKMASQ